jgi:hypothetical protein
MSWGTFTGAAQHPRCGDINFRVLLTIPQQACWTLTAARMVTRLDKGVDKGMFEEVFHLMIVSLD